MDTSCRCQGTMSTRRLLKASFVPDTSRPAGRLLTYASPVFCACLSPLGGQNVVLRRTSCQCSPPSLDGTHEHRVSPQGRRCHLFSHSRGVACEKWAKRTRHPWPWHRFCSCGMAGHRLVALILCQVTSDIACGVVGVVLGALYL